jgi:hypothetical protein
MQYSDISFKPTKVPRGIQARISYDSYELSIVQNECSYGNELGLFEIAVYKDKQQTPLEGVTEDGDTVKGFLTQDMISGILTKMTEITQESGVQL